MKPLLTIVFIFAISFGFAQKPKRIVYLLKNNGMNVTIRDSADFIRIVSEPDSGSDFYNIAEYYKDGNEKLIGKTAKIDQPVFEGQCVRFYKSGGKRSITNYKHGFIVGDEYHFYPNGKLYQLIAYPDTGGFNHKYLIKEYYDTLGTQQVENGNGYYKSYNENVSDITEEGNIKNGKRNGVWKGDDKTLKLTFIETYADGKLITGLATYDDGTNATYANDRGIQPQFSGGLKAFYKYLGNNIRYPSDARYKNIQGRVVLTFLVEKDGKVDNIVVIKPAYPSLDAEAVRVIKNSPAWQPAIYFGRPVKVSYSVPISFSLARN